MSPAQLVDTMTVPKVRELAAKYIRPDAMTYVIVGDASTQAARLAALGLGEPVMIKRELDTANE